MTAETVYAVSQELSESEKKRLYNMLKQDLKIEPPKPINYNEFRDIDALKYLHEHLFNKQS